MSVTKTIILGVLAVFGFLFIVGIIFAMFDSANESYQGRADDTEINVQQEYVRPINDRLTQATRDQFNEGCYNGANESYCNCLLDWFQENYTNDEFDQIAIEYSETGMTPESLNKAIDFCIEGAI